MVAPGPEARDPVVEGIGGEEHGAQVRLAALVIHGVGVGEEARNVPQAPDRRVVHDPLEVVEWEADVEAARVGPDDPEGEDDQEQAREDGPFGKAMHRAPLSAGSRGIAKPSERTPGRRSTVVSMRISPYRVAVPQAVLDDLHERLARTRWPDEVSGAGWDYGASLAYMKDLVEHWRRRFDWRVEERALNAFAHFRAEVDGLAVHFAHE